MRWFHKDDGIVEIGAKLATIGGIAFGVYAYFHTIYPVFERESELLQAKGEVQALRNEGVRLTTDLELLEKRLGSLDEDVRAKAKEIEGLQDYASQKASEALALDAQAKALSVTLAIQRLDLVKETVFRFMDKIANEAVMAEVNRTVRMADDDFDLQAQCLKVAQDGLARSPKGHERTALLVLQLFATSELEPAADWKEIFKLMMFVQFDERSLALIQESD